MKTQTLILAMLLSACGGQSFEGAEDPATEEAPLSFTYVPDPLNDTTFSGCPSPVEPPPANPHDYGYFGGQHNYVRMAAVYKLDGTSGVDTEWYSPRFSESPGCPVFEWRTPDAKLLPGPNCVAWSANGQSGQRPADPWETHVNDKHYPDGTQRRFIAKQFKQPKRYLWAACGPLPGSN